MRTAKTLIRLGGVFAGCTVTLLVLSCRSSFQLNCNQQRKGMQDMVVQCKVKFTSLGITVLHHVASLVMPNSYPHDRIFILYLTNEPPHDRTNKMTDQESSLYTSWVANDPSFLHADSDD